MTQPNGCWMAPYFTQGWISKTTQTRKTKNNVINSKHANILAKCLLQIKTR